jgi:hypothetical protein
MFRFYLIMMCFLLASCSLQRMSETRLYFGLSKPGDGKVSETEWNDFRKNYIGKIFKEGSTIIKAEGNWYDPDAKKMIAEDSYVVIYYYRKNSRLSKQIDSLRHWYQYLFQQQSVLRVDKKVRISF